MGGKGTDFPGCGSVFPVTRGRKCPKASAGQHCMEEAPRPLDLTGSVGIVSFGERMYADCVLVLDLLSTVSNTTTRPGTSEEEEKKNEVSGEWEKVFKIFFTRFYVMTTLYIYIYEIALVSLQEGQLFIMNHEKLPCFKNKPGCEDTVGSVVCYSRSAGGAFCSTNHPFYNCSTCRIAHFCLVLA